MFRRLTAESLTQDHEFSAVKTANGREALVRHAVRSNIRISASNRRH
jgi:hypothetical protein